MSSSVLGDIAAIEMGQSPPGSACGEALDGLPLLNGPTEFGGHHPVPKQFTTDCRKRALPGDLLFCVRGSTTGRMNWADQEYAIGRGLAAIRHQSDTTLQPLVRAVVESALPSLLAAATGSTFPNVSRTQLAEIPVPDLSYVEQRAIAAILGALDDKIELNRKMSRTLDETSQAIFRSWFVDFDGQALNNEMGIPNGWGRSRLGDHVDVVRGLSYNGAGLTAVGVGAPMHNLNSIVGGGGYNRAGLKWYDGEYRERHKVLGGELVVANTDLTQGMVVIGSPGLVPKKYESGLFSHHLYRMRAAQGSPLSVHYLYALLRDPTFHRHLVGYTNGTTVNMLPTDGLQMPMVTIPPEEAIRRYDAVAQPIVDRIEILSDESQTIMSVRDALLPRLLSGDLGISDARAIAERAV